MTSTNRDDFPQPVINALSRRSGQHCSNPHCGRLTSGPKPSSDLGFINVGVAAHITAAAPGGKRYDSSLTVEERTSPRNGIWLCQTCAKLIDSDEISYSIAVLREWKKKAELKALEAISGSRGHGIAVLERKLSGHTNMVWDLAITSDGRKIVSSSNDMTAKVWDAASGSELCTLRGHKAFVCSVSIASDNRRIATGALDGEVIIWNLHNAERLTQFHHGASDAKVSWTPDGNSLVTGGADGRLRVWRAGEFDETSNILLHFQPILKVACLRDNRRVASVSADQSVRVCDLLSMQCIGTFAGHTGEVNSVAITPDERFLISASGDHTVRMWDLDTGQCSQVLCGHDEVVWRVAVSPNGEILASGSGDDTVRLWSIKSGALLQTLPHPDCIAAVTFSPVDERLIVGCDDANIYMYKIDTKGLTASPPTSPPAPCASASP
jgi:WD40 repeat protein